jgi:hypothetical protein
MVEVEEANSVPEPETKEVLLRSLHHCIYAWIVLEYYNSFSLNVLALRILQTITSFRVKSTHADSFVAKTLVTAVITLQIVIFALQLILGPSNPVLLVFIGYSPPASGWSILGVDLIIMALLYINFTLSVVNGPSPQDIPEVDLEMGLARILRRRRARRG